VAPQEHKTQLSSPNFIRQLLATQPVKLAQLVILSLQLVDFLLASSLFWRMVLVQKTAQQFQCLAKRKE
jgi:hypothetical protein